jgi:GNAT superfamily N-acetyltransferase
MYRKPSAVPNARVIKFRNDKASASLCDWGDGTSSLAYLYSRAKGQGYATSLMETIVAYADSHHIRSIYMEVEQYGPKNQNSLTTDQLVTFYSKFGFVVDRDTNDSICMERISKTK